MQTSFLLLFMEDAPRKGASLFSAPGRSRSASAPFGYIRYVTDHVEVKILYRHEEQEPY